MRKENAVLIAEQIVQGYCLFQVSIFFGLKDFPVDSSPSLSERINRTNVTALSISRERESLDAAPDDKIWLKCLGSILTTSRIFFLLALHFLMLR